MVLSKDGGMQSLEVQGSMSLQVGEGADARLRLALTGDAGQQGFQFKTHPNIDKGLYASQNVLGLRDSTRPFPIGAPLGVLKWRFQTDDESAAPLSINCWPSVSGEGRGRGGGGGCRGVGLVPLSCGRASFESSAPRFEPPPSVAARPKSPPPPLRDPCAAGGQSYVNIEYQSQVPFDLHGVEISIPVPSGGAPQVNQLDGDWRYDARKGHLVWSIELIDASNASGALEFVVPAADPSTFFPVEVRGPQRGVVWWIMHEARASTHPSGERGPGGGPMTSAGSTRCLHPIEPALRCAVAPASRCPPPLPPLQVSFTANKTMCDIGVAEVTAVEGDAPVKFGTRSLLSTDEYVVE